MRQNQQEIIIQFTNDTSKNNLIFLFSAEGNPHLQKMVEDCIPEKYKNTDFLD